MTQGRFTSLSRSPPTPSQPQVLWNLLHQQMSCMTGLQSLQEKLGASCSVTQGLFCTQTLGTLAHPGRAHSGPVRGPWKALWRPWRLAEPGEMGKVYRDVSTSRAKARTCGGTGIMEGPEDLQSQALGSFPQWELAWCMMGALVLGRQWGAEMEALVKAEP